MSFAAWLAFPYGMTMLPSRRTLEHSNKLQKYNKLVELQIGAHVVPQPAGCAERA